MPIYEYQCRKCKHRFEKIRKFSDKPLKKCPECGGGGLEQLLSAPAVQFKGTGWYVTDYARKAGSGSGKASSESSGEDAGSSASPEKSGEKQKKTEKKEAKKH